MGIKRLSYYSTVMFLALVMLCSVILTVVAQTDTSISSIGLWEPPKNFVDPVTLKIQEFKSQGLNDEQITAKLTELGMGWYPETAATWMGRTLTPEEVAKMPVRSPAKAPSDNNAVTDIGRTSCWRTSTSSWTGVAANMVSGSMDRSSGQTTQHFLCVQLGGLDGATNWAEIVLTHNLGATYKWNTYDNDEGGWTYYMDKNTPITAADNYVIMLDGTHDSGGWHYNVWINNLWVRTGHLSNLWVQAGFQKEVYSTTGQFTNDASRSVFYPNWLHDASGWSYWRTTNHWWSTAFPVRETHYIVPYVCWAWQTWVQN